MGLGLEREWGVVVVSVKASLERGKSQHFCRSSAQRRKG